MGLTRFPNGIDAGTALDADVITQGGTATYHGKQNIVSGAGTITTPLTTVQGFTLQLTNATVPGGTVAVGDAAYVLGSATSNKIVVGTFDRGGTAMAAGTAVVTWSAWGV